MDQEEEIQEISEIEEIKHMMIEIMRTQETILDRLEHISQIIGKLKHPSSGKKK